MTTKEIAIAYCQAVNTYDESAIEKMVDENYIQHNPFVPTGRAAFISLLPKLREHGSKIQNFRMFQDGAYIVMHHLWTNARPFGADEMVAFHILRIDHRGLIAEHWNAMTDATLRSRTSLIGGQTEIRDLEKTEMNRSKIVDLFSENRRNEKLDIDIQRQHRVFAEGNFVLSISEAIANGIHSACYDLFRIENGFIAEQWNVYQKIPKENLANSNTMFNF